VASREHLRRFHFIREIASGGFGSVFLTKVMHADGFSRLVAVKLLKAQWSDSEEVARRMRDEARLLGLLRHRNIVDVIDLTSIDGRAAVIMEYLEAVDLRTVVQDLASKGLRLPARAGLDIVSASASALDAAYNRPPIPGDKPLRVIHRDIKPSNIMVDDTGMVKVLDFGVARSEIDNRESHTQELQFGSVDYMAPERLFFEPETPASDVYSLATTLYEILALEKFGKARGRPARHRAYLTDRLSFLRGGMSVPGGLASELETLLADGLAFNHEDRPTAAEFHQRARALARQMGGDDLSAWAETSLPPLIQEAQASPKNDNPLAGEVVVEDSKVFGGVTEQPSAPSVGAAHVLRQGALAEMEDTGAFVPSPPTGAPAQLRNRPDSDDVHPDGWDDGPTAVGGLTGPVRVPRPDNAEDVRRAMNAGPGRRGAHPPAPDLPDPADPFAQLIRSPLSPRPQLPAQSVPNTPSADSVTALADPMRAVDGPSGRPAGSVGYFDPGAPEASGPVPPLKPPPGVQSRPLEPVMPTPVVPAPAADDEPYESDMTVSVMVPPRHRAVAPLSEPSPVVIPSVPPRASSATIVPLDEDVDEDENEVTEMVGGISPVSVPVGVSQAAEGAGIPVSVPVEPSVVGAPDAEDFGIPVHGPTDAAIGSPHGASDAAVAAVPPAVPASASSPVVSDSGPTKPGLPSLEEVVPRTPDSRYAAELAAVGEFESELTEPAVMVDSIENAMERDSAPPSAEPQAAAPVSPQADGMASSRKSKAPWFAAAGCFVFFALGAGGLALSWSMGLQEHLADMGVMPADPSVVAAVDSGSGSGAEELAGALDSGEAEGSSDEVADGMVRFRVGLEGVRKLKVDCGGTKASGQDEATVEHGFDGDCAITAILEDRSRKTTRVASPGPGGYMCFSNDGSTCEAE
jgi:serine/threonine protein kinase